nr:MAG TPA: hypothetical protein [Caudoviricetes sp.]
MVLISQISESGIDNATSFLNNPFLHSYYILIHMFIEIIAFIFWLHIYKNI